MTKQYEYGIRFKSDKLTKVGKSIPPHRSGMTEDEAYHWLDGAETDGSPIGLFVVIRRPYGDWEDRS
jgi:hypothetical protein